MNYKIAFWVLLVITIVFVLAYKGMADLNAELLSYEKQQIQSS